MVYFYSLRDLLLHVVQWIFLWKRGRFGSGFEADKVLVYQRKVLTANFGLDFRKLLKVIIAGLDLAWLCRCNVVGALLFFLHQWTTIFLYIWINIAAFVLLLSGVTWFKVNRLKLSELFDLCLLISPSSWVWLQGSNLKAVWFWLSVLHCQFLWWLK